MASTDADTSIAATGTCSTRTPRLGALPALVTGSLIGSGVFSSPQNMAAGATARRDDRGLTC